jgi:hypothetical protein
MLPGSCPRSTRAEATVSTKPVGPQTVIELRDRGDINGLTLRAIERELDFEELRMEG